MIRPRYSSNSEIEIGTREELALIRDRILVIDPAQEGTTQSKLAEQDIRRTELLCPGIIWKNAKCAILTRQ